MLTAITRDEYFESIAFGTLRLLERWTGEGTLGGRDLAQVVKDQNVLAFFGANDIYKILDMIRNEAHNQGHSLRIKRKASRAEKRKLSQLTAIFAYVTPVWNEFRINALNERRKAEGLQVM